QESHIVIEALRQRVVATEAGALLDRLAIVVLGGHHRSGSALPAVRLDTEQVMAAFPALLDDRLAPASFQRCLRHQIAWVDTYLGSGLLGHGHQAGYEIGWRIEVEHLAA